MPGRRLGALTPSNDGQRSECRTRRLRRSNQKPGGGERPEGGVGGAMGGWGAARKGNVTGGVSNRDCSLCPLGTEEANHAMSQAPRRLLLTIYTPYEAII